MALLPRPVVQAVLTELLGVEPRPPFPILGLHDRSLRQALALELLDQVGMFLQGDLLVLHAGLVEGALGCGTADALGRGVERDLGVDLGCRVGDCGNLLACLLYRVLYGLDVGTGVRSQCLDDLREGLVSRQKVVLRGLAVFGDARDCATHVRSCVGEVYEGWVWSDRGAECGCSAGRDGSDLVGREAALAADLGDGQRRRGVILERHDPLAVEPDVHDGLALSDFADGDGEGGAESVVVDRAARYGQRVVVADVLIPDGLEVTVDGARDEVSLQWSHASPLPDGV